MAEFPPFYTTDNYNPLANVGHHIVDLASQMRGEIDRRAGEIGITGAQWVILLRLGASPDGWVSAAELCRVMDYDSGSMTRMLDRLEKRGMVCRRRSTGDRRIVEVFLTDLGRELYPRLRPIAIETLNYFLDGFTADEVTLLMSFLDRMLAKVVTG